MWYHCREGLRRRKILKVGGAKDIVAREAPAKIKTMLTSGQTAPIFERSTPLDFLHKRTNGKSGTADLAAT